MATYFQLAKIRSEQINTPMEGNPTPFPHGSIACIKSLIAHGDTEEIDYLLMSAAEKNLHCGGKTHTADCEKIALIEQGGHDHKLYTGQTTHKVFWGFFLVETKRGDSEWYGVHHCPDCGEISFAAMRFLIPNKSGLVAKSCDCGKIAKKTDAQISDQQCGNGGGGSPLTMHDLSMDLNEVMGIASALIAKYNSPALPVFISPILKPFEDADTVADHYQTETTCHAARVEFNLHFESGVETIHVRYGILRDVVNSRTTKVEAEQLVAKHFLNKVFPKGQRKFLYFIDGVSHNFDFAKSGTTFFADLAENRFSSEVSSSNADAADLNFGDAYLVKLPFKNLCDVLDFEYKVLDEWRYQLGKHFDQGITGAGFPNFPLAVAGGNGETFIVDPSSDFAATALEIWFNVVNSFNVPNMDEPELMSDVLMVDALTELL